MESVILNKWKFSGTKLTCHLSEENKSQLRDSCRLSNFYWNKQESVGKYAFRDPRLKLPSLNRICQFYWDQSKTEQMRTVK